MIKESYQKYLFTYKLVLSQCIRSFHQMSHRPDRTDIQLTVQNNDIGIFTTLQRTLAIVYSHQAGRRFRSHANSVCQRNSGILGHRTNQYIHCSDTYLPMKNGLPVYKTPSSMIIRGSSTAFLHWRHKPMHPLSDKYVPHPFSL